MNQLSFLQNLNAAYIWHKYKHLAYNIYSHKAKQQAQAQEMMPSKVYNH